MVHVCTCEKLHIVSNSVVVFLYAFVIVKVIPRLIIHSKDCILPYIIIGVKVTKADKVSFTKYIKYIVIICIILYPLVETNKYIFTHGLFLIYMKITNHHKNFDINIVTSFQIY